MRRCCLRGTTSNKKYFVLCALYFDLLSFLHSERQIRKRTKCKVLRTKNIMLDLVDYWNENRSNDEAGRE